MEVGERGWERWGLLTVKERDEKLGRKQGSVEGGEA